MMMNPNNQKRKCLFHGTFILLFLFILFLFSKFDESVESVMQNSTASNQQLTVVVDAGHGGRDPGKVGINGILEKDINLNIALKLKTLLEQNDIQVIMIREEDKGLYSENDSNKKAADMLKRVEIINNSNAVLAVSIHQNSFNQESIKGAQVFYFRNSEQSEIFAEMLQNQLKKTLKDGNKRVAKSNDSYYMLKKTKIPIVIIECGYLSNSGEASLLVQDDYQEKLAWSIHLGIFTYLNHLD